MGLSAEDIKSLLLKEIEKPTKGTGLHKDSPQATTRPRPTQIGPLKWFDKEFRCASRGCGSPTRVKVNGVPYCWSHSLYELNFTCLMLEGSTINLDCTCVAGKHSKYNIHTADCAAYQKDLENYEKYE